MAQAQAREEQKRAEEMAAKATAERSAAEEASRAAKLASFNRKKGEKQKEKEEYAPGMDRTSRPAVPWHPSS